MPEADAEGAPQKLCETTEIQTWYNLPETILHFEFPAFLPKPLLRAEFNPAEFKKILAEVLRNPFPQKMLSQNRVRF